MLKSLEVTTQEAHILDVAARIKFGEILNAELHCRKYARRKELNEAQERFVNMLRAEGWLSISKIVVHEGVPATVEIDGEDGSLIYKIKRKV